MRLTSQSGGGLVEVLVALVLMTVGLLGLMSAHSAALYWTVQSRQQSTAWWLAQDLGERVRANRGRNASAQEVGLAYVLQLDVAEQTQLPAWPVQLCQSVASACSVAEMAAADMAQWRAGVRQQLPQGSVWVSYSAEVQALFITVAWQTASERDTLPGNCPPGLRASTMPCVTWQVAL